MKTSLEKQKPAAFRESAPIAKQEPFLSNSAQLSMMGSAGGTDQFDEKMMARMQSFRDAQLPKAEAEADRLAASVTPGASLDDVKKTMGEKLGADFSDVRIHTGSEANDMASSIGAEAYTTGKDVYLGEGASAETAAHELVHTVQQGEVAGSGVSESVASGTVQMKPGMFSRLKKWYKDRKFRKEREKEAKAVAKQEANPTYFEPHIAGTNAWVNRDNVSELNRTEYFQDNDSTIGAAQVEAGEHDALFEDMDDDTKINELQKLASYISAQKKLNDGKELSDKDKALEKTYLSVLQKSSESNDFMKSLMGQLSQSAADVDSLYEKERVADLERDKGRLDNVRNKNKANSAFELNYKANQYDNVVRSETGQKFNMLRFMMSDARNLMTNGNRRNHYNELSRVHFSKQLNAKGDLYENENHANTTHEGQMKTFDDVGNITYTDVSRYVKNMNAATTAYRKAKGTNAGNNYQRALLSKFQNAEGKEYEDIDYGDMTDEQINESVHLPEKSILRKNVDMEDMKKIVANYALPQKKKA